MSTKVYYEATPNPDAMKFYWGASGTESVFFEDVNKATRSPLAHKLFGFPWMKSVLISGETLTVTKQDWVEWSILCDPLCDLIAEHIDSKEPILLPETQEAQSAPNTTTSDDDSPVVQQIKNILNTEIRPAVQMDGGEIVYDRYEDGVLYISMQGACSGCPSSSMTLKQGIETRIREAIPEVQEVVAV